MRPLLNHPSRAAKSGRPDSRKATLALGTSSLVAGLSHAASASTSSTKSTDDQPGEPWPLFANARQRAATAEATTCLMPPARTMAASNASAATSASTPLMAHRRRAMSEPRPTQTQWFEPKSLRTTWVCNTKWARCDMVSPACARYPAKKLRIRTHDLMCLAATFGV